VVVGAAEDWLGRVAAVRKWSRGDTRAPHKPLLLLFALGRLQQQGRNEPIAYTDAEESLSHLLAEFGPPHRTTPAYPFVRLAADGLWRLTTASGEPVEDQPAALRRAEAKGELEPEFASALLKDPLLLVRVARFLLESEFPESLQMPLAEQVGLDLDDAELARVVPIEEHRHRRTSFRDEVLVAYEYRCAMCGYEGRIGGEAVGLEAAHVQWWAYGGPDEIANGLALCSMHHLLFDRGVIGVNDRRTVVVSRHFIGHDEASRMVVFELLSRPLRPPQPGLPAVAPTHISWHQEQVFRGPARNAGEES